MRRVVEFEADFPDDQVEVDGEIVQFGGHNPAQILREALIGQGWTAGPVEQHSENVWYFDMSGVLGKATIYLSDMRPKYVVTLERRAWLQDLLGRSEHAFRDSLDSLERALTGLGGEHLTWFTTYDATDRSRASIDEVMRA
ncbi:MAG: hypothetical protein ACT4N8_14415 [Sphingosinicella sp.]|uniref:hypothetical protein n=1 Tax=Sphingosinicella sp. TaxID=1917971 RepID=UPI0040382124